MLCPFILSLEAIILSFFLGQLFIEFGFVLVIPSQNCVNLSQRQVRIILYDMYRTHSLLM